MARVKLYESPEDAKARQIQEGTAKAIGFVPRALQAMGRDGDFLDAITKLERAAGSNLDPKTRELIMVAVSSVNGCGYCVDAHRAMGLKSGATEEEISGAIEVASMISAFNNFLKTLGLEHDITAEKLGAA